MELPPGSFKPSHEFPFILVEGNLGMPKKVIYSLYLAASAIKWRSAGSRDTIAATTVILILNPAHQSALNARKRLILGGNLTAERELVVTELLLRGLTECAKQSMVWDHRRWCLNQIYGPLGPGVSVPSLQGWATPEEAQFFPKISPVAIRRELDLIHYTCETYPRNYHAWTHWHWLIDSTHASIYISEDAIKHEGFPAIIVEAVVRVRNWTDLHPSDFSAMHQLCQSQVLIDHLDNIGVFKNHEIEKKLSLSKPVDHVLGLIRAYPTHESLWMYLRISLECSKRDDLPEFLRRIESEFPSNQHAGKMLEWFTRSLSRFR